MAGKYAKVIHALPKLLSTDASYQDKVEAVKKAMKAEPGFVRRASTLAAEYTALYDEKATMLQALYDINLRLEAMTLLMAEQFEAEALTSVKTLNGRSVGVYLEPYATVEEHETFQSWCMEDPALRSKLQLPWNTVNALAKERLLAGEPELPGVKIYAKTRIRVWSK